MAKRPAPSVNALAGASIYQPPQVPVEGSPAPVPPPARESKKTSQAKRGAFHVRGDLATIERARTAWWNTAAQTGVRSFSEFVLLAVLDRVEALEAQYNDGQHYGPTPAGEIPLGMR